MTNDTTFNIIYKYGTFGYTSLINQTRQHNTLLERSKNILGDVAVRFVGLQAALGFARQSFQQLQRWVGESIDEFRSFELRMNEVSTILGTMGKQVIPTASNSIEQFSKQFGKSVQDLTKGYYDIVSAAFGAEEGIYLLNIATQASIAGLSDVSVAVDTLTSILNAYGMTAAQSSDVSDIMFQTVRYGKLVFEDLASAMGYITPIAANAGIRFEEVAAALSSVTRMGLHVDMATRGLALLIQNVISPTQQAAEAAREYSVDMSALALRIGGLKGFMIDLNEAMHEHGASVIPEMIKNMRSLRVALALAGDEGIKGFTRDLTLMDNATGAAERAMIQIMQSAQISADIMSQSLEYAERRVGKAWSNFDLWWKKTQVWWGTLLSGGDANAAVKAIDDRINEINKSSLELLRTQLNINAGIGVEPEAVASFFELQDSMMDISKTQIEMSSRAMALKTTFYDLGIEMDKISKIPIAGIGKQYADTMNVLDSNTKLTTEQFNAFNKALEGTNLQLVDQNMTIGEVRDLYNQVTKRANDLSYSLEMLTEDYNNGLTTLQEYKAQWDDASQSLNEYEYNIVELQHAIKNLNKEISNVYTPKLLGGEVEFKGTLGYEKATKEFDMYSDRFKHFADMTIKYGDTFEGMTWFSDVQDDIWKVVTANNNYNGSISDLINSLSKYGKEIKKVEEEQKKLQKITDANTMAMQKNNLEIMKLELRGMLRRRGLSRDEQKAIKKYNIENTKLRIDSLEHEIEASESVEKTKLDNAKSEYNRLKEIIAEYYDREDFYAWKLKDVREDELNDLQDTIDYKQMLLTKYGTWLTEQVEEYSSAWQSYYDGLKKLAETSSDVYKKLFGEDAFEKLKQNMKDFSEMTGITFNVDTKPIKSKTSTIAVIDKINESIKSKRGRTSPTLDLLKRIIPQYKAGIESVPRTEIAMVHKGEKIIPAGQSPSGNIIIQNVNIEVKEIAELGSAEKLTSLLSVAQQSRLLKDGKTRYRMR